MRRALELAWRGWGRVSPNPLVGAVLLGRDGVVAEGWHAEFGGPHAEVNALRVAGDKAHGATLVVTLEPCAHQGKTPPCTDAIRAAGIRRVVAALRDPDSDAGGGAAILKRAGIETDFGLLAAEAAGQNAAFLSTRLQTDRPFVALKLATSIDGRIADVGGGSQWISGTEAREHVHWLRAGFDAIAVGGTTALTDNPQLTVRGDVTPRRPPVRVVFDRRLARADGA
jgi:diaminohydroxyphosphoribosylaminopyrimidine deaminase/5-amino-6-(5-phosphoribosylamino)uracil reductase